MVERIWRVTYQISDQKGRIQHCGLTMTADLHPSLSHNRHRPRRRETSHSAKVTSLLSPTCPTALSASTPLLKTTTTTRTTTTPTETATSPPPPLCNLPGRKPPASTSPASSTKNQKTHNPSAHPQPTPAPPPSPPVCPPTIPTAANSARTRLSCAGNPPSLPRPSTVYGMRRRSSFRATTALQMTCGITTSSTSMRIGVLRLNRGLQQRRCRSLRRRGRDRRRLMGCRTLIFVLETAAVAAATIGMRRPHMRRGGRAIT